MFAIPKQKLTATQSLPAQKTRRSHLEVVEPSTRSTPPWFRLMLGLRRVSTPLVVVLTLSVLPLYGWTVYTQKTWGKTYAELEQLQRTERDLLLQNESRQHDITDLSEKNPAGLTPRGPHNTLFMKPEAAQLPQAAAEGRRSPIRMSPIGY